MRIHPIAPDLPQECIAIHAQIFMGIQFHTTHDVRSYEDWFERDSQDLAYDFHRRLLQHLQTQRPGDRWVLKAPGHLFSLAALLRRYPNAKIVQTHRDPLRVMASMASHATVLRRAFSDSANPRQIAADWAERWARALDEFLAVRDRAPAAQFLDVSYDSIESAPLETIERVYDFLGWPLTRRGARSDDGVPRRQPEEQARRASLHARAVRPRPRRADAPLRPLLRPLPATSRNMIRQFCAHLECGTFFIGRQPRTTSRCRAIHAIPSASASCLPPVAAEAGAVGTTPVIRIRRRHRQW